MNLDNFDVRKRRRSSLSLKLVCKKRREKKTCVQKMKDDVHKPWSARCKALLPRIRCCGTETLRKRGRPAGCSIAWQKHGMSILCSHFNRIAKLPTTKQVTQGARKCRWYWLLSPTNDQGHRTASPSQHRPVHNPRQRHAGAEMRQARQVTWQGGEVASLRSCHLEGTAGESCMAAEPQLRAKGTSEHAPTGGKPTSDPR